MAVEKLKALLDELTAVVAEMEAMSETPAEDGAEPMTEEQEASLRSLGVSRPQSLQPLRGRYSQPSQNG